MNRKKIILVAKCYESSTSGPANIVRNIIKYSKKSGVVIEDVLLTERVSKWHFIKNVFSKYITSKGNIINTHTDGFLIPLLVFCISLFDRKNYFFLTVHGIYAIDYGTQNFKSIVYCALEKFLYKNFPNIICVSKMLADDLVKMHGRKKTTIVIPNATDAYSEYGPLFNKKINIVLLGGLKINKGILESLELLELLKKEGVFFKTSVYGSDDGNIIWLSKQLKDRDLVNDVEYKGVLCDRQELYDVVAKSDIQLCLSKYDTFNVAIAESLVLGCPVISSDKCGASYLIDSVSGLVISIKEERKEGFKKTISYIKKIQSKTYRELVYENRTKYMKQLSWKSIVFKYASLQQEGEKII